MAGHSISLATTVRGSAIDGWWRLAPLDRALAITIGAGPRLGWPGPALRMVGSSPVDGTRHGLHATTCPINAVRRQPRLLATVRAGIDYYRTVVFTLIGNSIISDLRSRLYAHLQTLSLNFHSRTRAGDLTVRLTSDVNMLKDVTVSAALPLVSSALLLAGMLSIMLWINWKLGW